MKPAGISLLFLVVGGAFGAENVTARSESPPPPPVRLSLRLTEVIRAQLPKYVAPVATAAPTDAPAADPDVLVLPKMVVKERRLPTNDPDAWLGEKAVQQKAMAAYKASLTDLEWALNSWYIPLFGTPPAARARAAYESAKKGAEIDRLTHIIDVSASADPKEAVRLLKELQHDPDQR